MIWDKESYPDPAGMIRELKDMGFKVCLWINSSYIGIESERFTEAQEQGYFLKTPQGDVYVLPLWNWYHPPVGIVDFTNPEAVCWFKELLRPLLQMGVDVFKTDFGEGVPADAVTYNGMSDVELHNYYTLLYNDAVAEVTSAETSHETITGPQMRFIDVPLEVLPLYVRAGALIPTSEPTAWVADGPFEAYLLNSSGNFMLRDTDGVTELSAAYEGSRLRFQVSGAKKQLGIRVIPLAGMPVVKQIQVNGAPLSHVENLKIGRHIPGGWTRAVDGTLIVEIAEE